MATTETFVDTNIFLDVTNRDATWLQWSRARLVDAMDNGGLVLNQIVYAELAAGFSLRETLDIMLKPWAVRNENLPWDAAFMAGKAFVQYRRSGGSRTMPLPDFFIGAHAAIRGYRLLTRDRRTYVRFFPTLTVIAPELPA